tara:strand:- start:432 stop:596 length:165 start_codon:yes stop_codon:yes gene_type:complete
MLEAKYSAEELAVKKRAAENLKPLLLEQGVYDCEIARWTEYFRRNLIHDYDSGF